jgi:hypothetical protein
MRRFQLSDLNKYLVFCIVVACGGTRAHGADYRVTPDRAAPGFHTIAACFAGARPGDTCRLAPGRYAETAIPPSGTMLAGQAGSLIDGTDPLSGWTAQGGNIWTIPYTRPHAITAVQIFIDGKPGNEARWPNATPDPIRPAWSRMAAGTTATHIIDPNLPAGNWKGATVHIFGGADPYSHLTAPVVGSQAGALTLDRIAKLSCPTYCAAPGSRYYIFGQAAAFDAPGEWLLVGGTLTLMMPAGLSPEGHVRAKARTLGVDLRHSSNATVQGVRLFAATIETGRTTTNDLIEGVTAKYVSEFTILDGPKNPDPIGAHVADSGIILAGSHHTLENSIVTISAGNGVLLNGDSLTVQNNLIENAGYLGSYVAPIEIIAASNSQILHNTVALASGYGITGGLDPATIANLHVAYNNVHDVLLERVDGGGIYFCCAGTPSTGLSIDHNWVHSFAAPLPPHFGDGIYIDNGLGDGVTMTQNFVERPSNNEGAIAANGNGSGPSGQNNVITFNTVLGGKPGSNDIWYDNQTSLTVTDNRIPNNLGDYGNTTYAPGSPARNSPSAAGATDLGADPNKAGVGCNFQGCASPPPPDPKAHSRPN